jgi:Ca2+-binding EF-hand superfamily protein
MIKSAINIIATLYFSLSGFCLFAENGSKGANSPMVVGVIESVSEGQVVVATRDKFKRELTLNPKSKIIYVGFDEEEKEMKAKQGVRAQVKNEVISSIYVAPDIGVDEPVPTAEMVKMNPSELFKYTDKDENGKVSYVEYSKTVHYSLKHGPVGFSKSDRDKSGSLNEKEFSAFLTKTKWWNLSRKTPEEWLKSSDKDKNGVLSDKELAILLGSEAHLDVFFKRADSNSSGDLDQKEVASLLHGFIFPSKGKRKK